MLIANQRFLPITDSGFHFINISINVYFIIRFSLLYCYINGMLLTKSTSNWNKITGLMLAKSTSNTKTNFDGFCSFPILKLNLHPVVLLQGNLQLSVIGNQPLPTSPGQ